MWGTAMAKRLVIATVAALVAGGGMAIGCAVALALVDLYLTGHGQPALGRPWIDTASVHMSRADVALVAVTCVAALVAGLVTWRQLGPPALARRESSGRCASAPRR